MPARPKLVDASDTTRFPTWDELVSEATVDLPPYQLPMPVDPNDPDAEPRIIEIPVLDGDHYIDLVDAQRRGDIVGVFRALFENDEDRALVRRHMKGVHFPIMDKLATKVIRYFYGLSIEAEERSGNSPAS